MAVVMDHNMELIYESTEHLFHYPDMTSLNTQTRITDIAKTAKK